MIWNSPSNLHSAWQVACQRLGRGFGLGNRKSGGFSLVEMLAVVAVIGILAAIAVPSVGRVFESATEAKATRNAQQIASLSSDLAAMGVAHVIPPSLGGVEATARLLREGVTVNDELFKDRFYQLRLSDDEIAEAALYLDVIFGHEELHLVFRGRQA